MKHKQHRKASLLGGRFGGGLLLLFFLLSLPASSQRRGKKVQKPVYTVTAQEAMAAYDFALAAEILEYQIGELTKKKQPTINEERLLEAAHNSQIKLRATEQVTFIDSLVLPKNEVLKQIRLSQESGSIMTCADFFKAGKGTECTLFLNELGNRIVYSEANAKGHLRLLEKTLIGGEWSQGKQLTGFREEEDDNLNFPFMLSDGITMYYAAECEESLGGYDIFMTRYDADEGQFLAPENIGMPFNSPANDYLMVIDEFLQLGWFVTDRNQPEDKVCLYMFIPTETRRIFNADNIGKEKLASLARIMSIKDTWTDIAAVNEAKERLAEARQDTKDETKNRDFTFVVNDSKTCYSLTDFKNSQAQQKAKTWHEAQKAIDEKTDELKALRERYATMNDAERSKIKSEILLAESIVERLAADQLDLEKEIRRLELNH